MNEEIILIDFWSFEIDKKKFIGLNLYSKKSRVLVKSFCEYSDSSLEFLQDNLYYDIHAKLTPVFSNAGKLKLYFSL